MNIVYFWKLVFVTIFILPVCFPSFLYPYTIFYCTNGSFLQGSHMQLMPMLCWNQLNLHTTWVYLLLIMQIKLLTQSLLSWTIWVSEIEYDWLN